jgi:hypothetical protein
LSAAQTRDEVRAEALFRAGREASKRGQHAEACARFKESYRLDQTAGTLLNIAVCEEELGELASSWQRYQGVLDALPASDERVAIARSGLLRLERRIPLLTLRLARGAPSGTKLRLGSTVLGLASLGLPLPVDPGRHTLIVEAPGYEDRRFDVELREGDKRELVLSPGAARSRSEALRGADSRKARSRRTLGYWLLAAGGTGLAAGAVVSGFAVDRAATVNKHCDELGCNQAGLDASRQGKNFVAIAIYCFAIGIAGVGSGAHLLLSTPLPDRGVSAVPAHPSKATSVSISGEF